MINNIMKKMYASSQNHFREWSREMTLTDANLHEIVARYLRHCRREFGVTTVPPRLSALAAMFRAEGRAFDTKSPILQRVVAPAREAMRKKKAV
jgi:hypothetical protein